MSEWEAQELRIEKILGEESLRVSDTSLAIYRSYLQNNLALPCELTGGEDFPWEEIYVFGPGDKTEYEELKKTRPSHTDIFAFIAFDDQIADIPGLMVRVKRLSDKKQFVLPLVDLEAADQKSPNYQLIHDYVVWNVNY